MGLTVYQLKQTQTMEATKKKLNIKDSIQRMTWRFGQGKAFKPNENDVEALNEIINFYNEKTSTIQFSQEPFAKMYLYLYSRMLINRDLHGADVLPARLLTQILDAPKSHLITEIAEHVESVNLQSYFDKYITSHKLQRDMSKEEFENHANEIAEIPVDNFKKYRNSQLSVHEISMKLVAHINHILENYKGDD